jgi:hypothetical protein
MRIPAKVCECLSDPHRTQETVMKAFRTSPPKRTQPVQQEWRAVSIVAKPGACQAAEGLNGKRFLSAEAPLLPLRECTSPGTCKCTYAHLRDRRSAVRRAADRGLPTSRVAEDKRDRNRGGGRRADDLTIIPITERNWRW